jgi:hypothetical protein
MLCELAADDDCAGSGRYERIQVPNIGKDADVAGAGAFERRDVANGHRERTGIEGLTGDQRGYFA